MIETLLLKEIIDIPSYDYQNQIKININIIRKNATNLIAQLLQRYTTNKTNLTKYYQLVLEFSENCKQKLNDAEDNTNNLQHNTEMTSLSKEANNILAELLKLVSLFSDIENYYKNAKRDVDNISSNITDLKSVFLENKQNLSTLKPQIAATFLNSTKSKQFAKSNRKRLMDINFHQTPNKSVAFCAYEIPNYKSDLENTLNSHFENCLHEQSVLEKLSNELKVMEEESIRLEEQNNNDRKSLKAVYETVKGLIDKLDGKISVAILNTTDLNEENENKLLILQEELQHLIEKLEMFSLQLLELDLVTNKNLNFLDVSITFYKTLFINQIFYRNYKRSLIHPRKI